MQKKPSDSSSKFLIPKWLLWVSFVAEMLYGLLVVIHLLVVFASQAEQNPAGALGYVFGEWIILFYWLLYVPGFKIMWKYLWNYPPSNKPFKYKVSRAPGWFVFVVMCFCTIAFIVASVSWSIAPGNTLLHIGGGLLLLLGIFLVLVVPGYTLFSYLRQLPKDVKKK